ncbi:MAG: porin family protein [Muribaculaceae bacterium]|nr:porin family protein [Muribaculaceae bacterium]
MIKKLIAAVAVALVSLTGAYAQKAEISLSYGAYTQMDATDMKDGWKHVNTAWGALNAGLNFKVARNIWIGPSYTFSSTTSKGGPEHSNIAYHAVMFNGRYHYYSNSIVSLYAKLGLGVEFSYMQPRDHDNYTKSYCAFQIVPVGAQVNLNRDWAMYAEAGFGAQGLFQFGFKYRF